jgi:hypothetical protein
MSYMKIVLSLVGLVFSLSFVSIAQADCMTVCKTQCTKGTPAACHACLSTCNPNKLSYTKCEERCEKRYPDGGMPYYQCMINCNKLSTEDGAVDAEGTVKSGGGGGDKSRGTSKKAGKTSKSKAAH